MDAQDELHSALQSLSSPWDQQEPGESIGEDASQKNTEDKLFPKESAAPHRAVRNRMVSKIVYSLPPGVSSNGSPHWV